jgi:hypothetical protein
VRTNLTLFQVIRLAWLARQVPEESIQRGVIGPNQATFSNSEDGQEILVPIPEAIRFQRDEIFTLSGPIVPAANEADRRSLVDAEDASIQLLNGTTSPGLASDAAAILQEAGLTNLTPGNSSRLSSRTMLIDYTGNPHTVSYLAELLQIDPSNVYARYDVSSLYDIVIIIGQDREPAAQAEQEQSPEEQTPATSPSPAASPTPVTSPTPGPYP